MKYLTILVTLLLGVHVPFAYSASVNMEVKLEILPKQNEIKFDKKYRSCSTNKEQAICNDVISVNRKHDFTVYEMFVEDGYVIYEEKGE